MEHVRWTNWRQIETADDDAALSGSNRPTSFPLGHCGPIDFNRNSIVVFCALGDSRAN